jgi:FkbM family methyltransferase
MINNDKIELFNGIALLKDDQCICRFIRESGRLDHDQNILPLVLEYIPEGGTVFDIGAFIGDTTLAYAEKVGNNGIVFAIEPSKDAFECLTINMSKKKVSMFNLAIGNESKFIDMAKVDTNLGMNHVIAGNEIEMTTFDKFLNERPIDRLDFIKIDVEGSELDVLIGGEKTIQKYRPKMLIEINEMTLTRKGITREDIYTWLDVANYTYRNIYPNQGLNEPQMDIICLPN